VIDAPRRTPFNQSDNNSTTFASVGFLIESPIAAISECFHNRIARGTLFANHPIAIDHDGSRPHEDQMRQVVRGLP
jgi:hypothetical protein